MNAIELADYLDAREINNPYLKQAAIMLLNQQSEIEALKAKLNYAKETIESIVWKDRKPFDEAGCASVSFSALAKGADFLRKLQDQ